MNVCLLPASTLDQVPNTYKLQIEKDISCEVEAPLTKVELIIKLGKIGESLEHFRVTETSLERIF